MSEQPPRPTPSFTRAINEDALGRLPVELQAELHDELHKIAETYMRGASGAHTLQATALMNEAVLRISAGELPRHFESRGHFFAFAARAMRSILVDHARKKFARKRGGDWRQVTLAHWTEPQASGFLKHDESTNPASAAHLDLLDLSDALDDLAAWKPELAEMVELRYFGGLSPKEMADACGLSERTVIRRLRVAVTWLLDRLGAEGESDCMTKA